MCQSKWDLSLQISWIKYRSRPFKDLFYLARQRKGTWTGPWAALLPPRSLGRIPEAHCLRKRAVWVRARVKTRSKGLYVCFDFVLFCFVSLKVGLHRQKCWCIQTLESTARLKLLGLQLPVWFSKILRKYRFIHVIAYLCSRAYPHTHCSHRRTWSLTKKHYFGVQDNPTKRWLKKNNIDNEHVKRH